MNVVFLSPHFPPPMYHFCRGLREAGATVLGIADAPWDSLRPELRDILAEYYRVDDLHNLGSVVRALGWLTHRHGKIDRIDSLNEYWLETEARLRTEFNVPGIRLTDIARVKRKSLMKRVFQKAGVPVARGRICRTASSTHEFIQEVGYPVIAKPDVGVGAARTYRIGDDLELEAYLGERPRVDYLLEECLDGQILSWDGLVDRSGEVVFSSSLTYGRSVLDAVAGDDMYYWIDRSVPDDLDELGRRILAAFRVRERPFHFEFFRLADGQLVALEVNMRQPGGLTVDMWNYGNDIDFYRMWADVVVHGTTSVRTSRPWAVAWAGRKRVRTYRLSHDEVMARFRPIVVHHERVDDVFAAAIGNEGYILRGPSPEPLIEAARAIQETAA